MDMLFIVLIRPKLLLELYSFYITTNQLVINSSRRIKVTSCLVFFKCISVVLFLTNLSLMRLMDALDAVLLPMHTVQRPDEPRVLGSAPDEPISHLMKKCPSQTN